MEIYKEQHADLILLDIKMPEMNGIDALKEIRKFDQDIPIIMQSAYAFENDMEAALLQNYRLIRSRSSFMMLCSTNYIIRKRICVA